MTYTEAMDKCEELGNYKMASTTDMNELLFVHYKVMKEQRVQMWLRLK